MADVVKTITIRGDSVGVDKLLKQMDGLGVAFKEVTASGNQSSASFTRLRNTLDPVWMATQRFEKAQVALNRELDTGRISLQQHTALTESARQRMVAITAAADASAGGFRRQAVAANAAGAAMQSTGQNVGNLAAQFQDIGVTAAMGMSPMMIALQQGTQLSAAFAQSSGGVIRSLGAAFASVVSPVSLATIAIVGLGAYGIQALMGLFTESENVNGSLEEQANILQAVAQRWGDAVPALRDYANEVARLKDETDLLATTQSLVDQILQQSRASFGDIAIGVSDITLQMQQLGASSNDVAVVQTAVADLEAKIKDGATTSDQMKGSIDALASALSGSGVAAAQNMIGELGSLSAMFLQTAASANQLQVQSALALDRGGAGFSKFGGGRGSDPRSIEKDDYYQGRYFPDPAQMQPARIPRASIGGGGGSRSSANDDIQRERDAVKSLIGQMEHERDIIGLTSLEREKANALRAAGKNVTDEERAAIINLVEQTHILKEVEKLAAEEKKKLAEAQKAVFKNMGTDIVSNFNGIFDDGKVTVKEFGDYIVDTLLNMNRRIMDRALKPLEDALNAFFDGIGKGGEGGIFANLFGGLFGAKSSKAVGGIQDIFHKGFEAFAADNDNQGSAGSLGGGSVAEQAFQFFKAKGLKDFQAAAILGHMKAESNFNPMATGDGGTSFGLFQHHKDRASGLMSSLGGKANLGDVQGQLRYAWQELQGPESGAFSKLMNAGNLRDAVKGFGAYERPQGYSAANPEAMHNFIGRLNGAEKALSEFGGTTIDAKAGLGDLGSGMKTAGGALQQLPSLIKGGSGSGFASLLSGLFPPAPGGAIDFGVTGLFAKGGVFTNKVVDKPTLFPFAKGTGLMGEAGPEAIMPLRRGSDGSLGVQVHGGSSSVSRGSNITFINNGTPQRAKEEREEDDGRGGRKTVYVLEDMVATAITRPGSPARRALGRDYGVAGKVKQR
jgi:hypothetical protein